MVSNSISPRPHSEVNVTACDVFVSWYEMNVLIYGNMAELGLFGGRTRVME